MKTQIVPRVFDHLQPGGWLECQEVMVSPCCDDGTMPDDFGWLVWARDLVAASELAGKQLVMGDDLKEWMKSVGFINVRETVIKIPIGGWPKDRRLRQMGMLWQWNLLSGLSGFTLGLFNRVLGRTVEEIQVCGSVAEIWCCCKLCLKTGQRANVESGFASENPAEHFRPQRSLISKVVYCNGTETRVKALRISCCLPSDAIPLVAHTGFTETRRRGNLQPTLEESKQQKGFRLSCVQANPAPSPSPRPRALRATA